MPEPAPPTSPPAVVVTTTGVKTDFADPPVRSQRPPAPPDTPQITDPGQEHDDDRTGD